MSVTIADIKFRKSSMVSDSPSNGGVAGRTLVVSGVRHNLFPRVSKAERTTGFTRYRKEFFCNENAANETAYGSLFYFEVQSTALDRFYLGVGTQKDTQADLSNTTLVGTGLLSSDVTTGDTSISINMESNDFEFIPGGFLHITDKFMVSQTIDSGVSIGDSVNFNTTLSKWVKIAQTDDIVYPSGILVDSSSVMTIQGSTYEEWLQISSNQYTESIGTGDGSSSSPALTTLGHYTNGIFGSSASQPVVTTISGGNTKTVIIDKNGICSGDCTAGQLNMSTGAWTVPISWTDVPDNAADISITYNENPYTYSGNTVTVSLLDPTVNSYSASTARAGGCAFGGDVSTGISDWAETSTSGTYDESTYPVSGDNKGTVEDSWTLTMTSSTDFDCVGINTGAVSSGTVGTDFTPINPDTGTGYFTLPGAGWSGTWATGDTVNFSTSPAKVPLWLKEVVDAGTPADSNNLFVLGFYAE